MERMTPEDDVLGAIRRREEQGNAESICEMLRGTQRTPSEYWVRAAIALHGHGHHYEARECWANAKEADTTGDFPWVTMAEQLWFASEVNSDAKLGEEAIGAYERGGEWQDAAWLSEKIGRSKQVVLDLLWKALETDRQLTWPNDWLLRQAPHLQPVCLSITVWSDMAAEMLQAGDLVRAFQAWSNHIRIAPSEAEDLVAIDIIPKLISRAVDNGLSCDDLPSWTKAGDIWRKLLSR